VTAGRRPESQEQILQAAVASLTEADIPPDGQDGWLDPDTGPPGAPPPAPAPARPRAGRRSRPGCAAPARASSRRPPG
jgi:hypothetical protein